MDTLARILLQVKTRNADAAGCAILQFNVQMPLPYDGTVILRNLVTGRKVRIKVVLPVKDRGQINLRIDPQSSSDGFLNTNLVNHGQHARHGRIHKRNLGIGLSTKGGRCS